jgi:large repetitive protein
MSVSTLCRFALAASMATTMLVGCGSYTDANVIRPIGGNADALPHHLTFRFTGAKQMFQVPSGVHSINVDARGAAGAPFPYGGRYPHKGHGRGGRVHTIIQVSPGETLYVFVGGKGYAVPGSGGGTGFNGGAAGGLYPYCQISGSNCYGYGGGGASDLRKGGELLTDRIVVAGGGGGGGTFRVAGGGGGRTIGGDGESGSPTGYFAGGGGGGGGTQNQGGSGGSGQDGSYGNGGPGSPGTLGNGGSGGEAGGYGNSGYYPGAGGGGGGGYYGGGGGGGACGPPYSGGPCGVGGGGGGGSSYVEPSATNVKMWRNWTHATGNGVVILSW